MALIPEEEYMDIKLKDNYVKHLMTSWVYPVSHTDREVIDKEFDQLHLKGKMSWSAKLTQFNWPVFVVY